MTVICHLYTNKTTFSFNKKFWKTDIGVFLSATFDMINLTKVVKNQVYKHGIPVISLLFIWNRSSRPRGYKT